MLFDCSGNHAALFLAGGEFSDEVVLLLLDALPFSKWTKEFTLTESPSTFAVDATYSKTVMLLSLAKVICNRKLQELDQLKIPYDRSMKVGIMIEVPSIVSIVDLVAAKVDFASIGTNDLCQYLCAVDRMNPSLSQYYQPYSPAFLRVLAQIIDAFNAVGKEISMCGELAGDANATALLVGLGLQKFSAGANSLPYIKQAMAQFSLQDTKDVAAKALTARTQAEVLSLIQQG